MKTTDSGLVVNTGQSIVATAEACPAISDCTNPFSAAVLSYTWVLQFLQLTPDTFDNVDNYQQYIEGTHLSCVPEGGFFGSVDRIKHRFSQMFCHQGEFFGASLMSSQRGNSSLDPSPSVLSSAEMNKLQLETLVKVDSVPHLENITFTGYFTK